MPVHDWTKVDAGIFHSFHNCWIAQLVREFNGGLLPDGYYALSEQFSAGPIPDELTFDLPDPNAVYRARRRTLTIRHTSGHRIVAFLEIVSPANKDRTASVEQFVNKMDSALMQGIHAMVVDLFRPGRSDPRGVHGAIWARYGTEEYLVPADQPLTLASYRAAVPVEAYIEHLSCGQALPEMPLFLDLDTYISVPLELTYQAAFEVMPGFWRDVLEGRRPAP
jgi:hypothetical protein